MNTKTIIENQIISKDYFINYYGNIIEIKNTKKVLALFKSGSGHTGYMGNYYGIQNYDLYIPNEKDFGETLIKIGEGYSSIKGDDIISEYSINGISYTIYGFTIDNIFNCIMDKLSLK